MNRFKPMERNELRVVALFFLLMAAWIVARLVILQVWQHDYYALFASSTHELYRQLHPNRGEIYFQDTRRGATFPAAVNKEFYLLYAVPREIPASRVDVVAAALADMLGWAEPEPREALRLKLARSKSVYEQLARKLPREVMQKVTGAALPGVYFRAEQHRYYPEARLAAHLLGFTQLDDSERLVGRYGLEGYWDKTLTGQGGFIMAERGALGNLITLGKRRVELATPGAALLTTIDRTLQFKACERLRQGLEEFKAQSAALVLMNPASGAILALCSLPDFDPNNYSEVPDLSVFNNHAIFTPYEPGSVFKPIAMAAALDTGVVTPTTVYTDPCVRRIDGFTIHNARNKCYGVRTMTEVLQNSINTGMIWVEEKLGRERFRDYVGRFGFGKKTGVELAAEVTGIVSSLNKRGAIYGAVGSFGQGLTVTPLQLAAAYAAIANQGKLLKPYLVSEVRQASGVAQTTEPKAVAMVMSSRAAQLLTDMLVAVVDKHHLGARLPGYYVAGKTGTAQIPGVGGYTEATNHTFAGFAPADKPKVVLVVKYEAPLRQWAENTAGRVFKDVMQFALEYYNIPPKR